MNSLRYIDITPTSETSAVADGDIVFNPTELAQACPDSQPVYLVGAKLFDQDDNTAIEVDLVFTNTSTALGTLNSAPNISDANGLSIQGILTVASTQWTDVGGFKFASVAPTDMPVPMVPATNGTSLWCSLVARGAATYTAAGLKIRVFFQSELGTKY